MLHMHFCGRVEYPVRESVIEVFWEFFPRLSHFSFLRHYPAFDVHAEDVTDPLYSHMHDLLVGLELWIIIIDFMDMQSFFIPDLCFDCFWKS